MSKSKEKSLGQVLHDAKCHAGRKIAPPYELLDRFEREMWEIAAQAVAAVVREQCAQTAWSHYMDQCKRMGVSPSGPEHWNAAPAIRSMKP